jgi:nucleotide-binding universal stress UspA family protein
MVVLGTHGRQGIAHVFMGSVAETVARRAPCPVLIARRAPPAMDERLAAGRRPHLLVPVDGSPGAEAALGWVKALRGELPCDLTFVQFYSAPAEAERFGVNPEPAAAGAERDTNLIPLLERELRRWIGTLPGEGDVRLRFHALRGREPEDLADEARRLEPDLVVAGISRRLRGGPYRDLTARALVKALDVPVVCVPESLRPPADTRVPWVSAVLVGTDLTDFANRAIPSAHALLRGTGGLVEICHVHERGAGTEGAMDLSATAPLGEAERAEIEARLRQLIPPEAAALGITTVVSVVESTSAADGLLREAERIAADVIVIASHGRGGLKRALLGSMAEKVIRRAGRAVLVLHPSAP